MHLLRSLIAFSGLASLALAAPAAPVLPTEDAKFSIDKAAVRASIKCPTGLNGAKGGVVLLIPGTALDAQASYANGPFVDLLPKEGPGYDVCYISLPNYSLGDIQVSGEIVAYAIKYLAPKSSTGTISAIAHSQGAGYLVPWANVYWPSTRALVRSFVALAPDFHGTSLGGVQLVCNTQELASFGKGCSPSFLQQASNSKLTQAHEKLLTRALVPTTAFWTYTDEIVIPSWVSARLPGSTQFPLQEICGPLAIADHLSVLAAPAAYAIAVQAIKSPSGQADLSKFDKKQCFNFANSDLNYKDIVPTLRFMFIGSQNIYFSDGVYAKTEPPLKPYVCAAGAATGCSA